MDAVILGGGGFIGGHLARRLLDEGCTVRCIDIKPLNKWEQIHHRADNLSRDLRDFGHCLEATRSAKVVYNLAADMGGMGFIEANKARCMLSSLISTHCLLASERNGVDTVFYASSACVYNAEKQADPRRTGLAEGDAYPAAPEDGYGWEKLFSERMARHFREDFGLQTRIARYHNVYGPQGSWDGGREKAPAAICRKVALAKATGDTRIDIWGDGEQTRSFTYIDDCVEGTLRLTDSDFDSPLNIGSSEVVSINELVSIVEDIAGIQLTRSYSHGAPQGVRGRSSDNSLALSTLGWEPSTPLRSGIEATYAWIESKVKQKLALSD